MTTKNRRAPRPAPSPEGMLTKILRLPLILLGTGVVWLVFTLLSWPFIVGMQHLTDCCFIPHARGAYVPLGLVAAHGLFDMPADHMAAGLMFLNMPIGFIGIVWGIIMLGFAGEAWGRWKKLPKRNRVLRQERRRDLVRRLSRGAAIVTLAAFILCVPFIRQYEIVTDRAILVKHFFDWNEQVYPLAQLTRIHRSVTGRGLVSWDFDFSDGRSFTMSSPSIDALALLLARPGVRANVRIVDGHLQKTPEP